MFLKQKTPHFNLMLLIVSVIMSFAFQTKGHGVLTRPNPRGSLTSTTQHIDYQVDSNAPIDRYAHFPAGRKTTKAGSGKRQQWENSKGKDWTEFDPTNSTFVWRSSVCGDGKYGPFEHLKGGRYYYEGKIVQHFQRGGVVNVEVAINAHHNGFFELRLCNLDRCPGGEISPKCFQLGYCYKLNRVPVPRCEKGYSTECGPIDQLRKHRWYLPCYPFKKKSAAIQRFGKSGSMQYALPKWLTCKHCVLHWFWSSANNCNPPGVLEYFNGPNSPKWGNCVGQSGARGGVARDQKLCGGKDIDGFPEEYMACADIQIHSPVRR